MPTAHQLFDALLAIGDNVNTIYIVVQLYFQALSKTHMPDSESSSSIHQIRRDNLRTLLIEFSAARLAQGVPSKGVEVLFAEHIGVSRITLSHMKSSRNISDKMAAQIEARTNRESGWLDQPRENAASSPGLQAFLVMVGGIWQSGNAAERRRLMRMAKGGFQATHL